MNTSGLNNVIMSIAYEFVEGNSLNSDISEDELENLIEHWVDLEPERTDHGTMRQLSFVCLIQFDNSKMDFVCVQSSSALRAAMIAHDVWMRLLASDENTAGFKTYRIAAVFPVHKMSVRQVLEVLTVHAALSYKSLLESAQKAQSMN